MELANGTTRLAPTNVTGVEFRLNAPTLDFYVDVWLRDFGGRWLAGCRRHRR